MRQRLGSGLAHQSEQRRIIEKLNIEVNAGLESARIKAQLSELGASAIPGSPAQFGNFIVQETEKYAGVIRTAKIKAE